MASFPHLCRGADSGPNLVLIPCWALNSTGFSRDTEPAGCVDRGRDLKELAQMMVDEGGRCKSKICGVGGRRRPREGLQLKRRGRLRAELLLAQETSVFVLLRP